ncbi:two-component sensor histidine kinase [Inquilinus limosus]|uniref:histidine kinase n=2 Tax=Inquilinus limosus TaxID=171674 RepID=A0A211ZSG4_9PROT|nr:two-component sensor histidine kinase [Inquilinus limosus]
MRAPALPRLSTPLRLRARIKRFLPRTLFGRALVIIVTPMILAQAISTYVFFGRHIDVITTTMARTVSGEIGLTIDEIGGGMTPVARAAVFSRAQRNTGLIYSFDPGVELGSTSGGDALDEGQRALARGIRASQPYDFTIESGEENDTDIVRMQLSDGVLTVEVPSKRLSSFTTNLFYLSMLGSTVILSAVAIIFMRNQLRPIRRLAIAADRFGKGRDMPGFRPHGAEEIRQASEAFIDMRDRIRRQIQQRTEMLAGVSHDLRTPLTRMKLQLAMLGDGPDIDELRTDVDEMRQMIDAYLSFARGEGTEEATPTDLAAFLEEVVVAARREGADIAFDAPESQVLPLRREAMRRCLANLLSNARRHARHIWLTVIQDDGAVALVVDDDGPGIPPDQREEAMKPFVRLDESRNQETGGTGLGLAIARDVARRHGGDLMLSTSPMGGLRCTVRLPL